MIYCLTGKIIKKTLDSVVISCGGVGYFVQIPATTGEALPPAGQEGTVYTIMNVTENDVSLYGFAAEEQRDCFKMLTGVTGVGPKAALSTRTIPLREVNWLGDAPLDSQPEWHLRVKVRSTRPPAPAILRPISPTEAEVELMAPEDGVSAGQACVFYAEEGSRVLGGGWIWRGR